MNLSAPAKRRILLFGIGVSPNPPIPKVPHKGPIGRNRYMSKPDEGRRAFLIGAAVGAGAAAGLVPDAIAQTHPPHPAADSTATTAQAHAHGPGYGAFFND